MLARLQRFLDRHLRDLRELELTNGVLLIMTRRLHLRAHVRYLRRQSGVRIVESLHTRRLLTIDARQLITSVLQTLGIGHQLGILSLCRVTILDRHHRVRVARQDPHHLRSLTGGHVTRRGLHLS